MHLDEHQSQTVGDPLTLRDYMQTFLADWIDDVPREWHGALDGLSPAFGDIDCKLSMEPDDLIFPGRKGREPAEAPPGSHIFHMLDDLPPERVRAVIIGQDPYPQVCQATGRAFEQGDLRRWTSRAPRPTPSLRRIAQQLAVYRTRDPSYGKKNGAWPKLKKDLDNGKLDLQTPSEVFDHWQSQGVLMLNTGLTLTRYCRGGHPHQTRGHIPLWAPIVRGICQHVAEREEISVVFLTWGKKAREFLCGAGIVETCARPLRLASSITQTVIVDRDHPSTTRFLDGHNVFKETNEGLANLNQGGQHEQAICW